jgi:nucleoid DNA-binding protein
MTKADLADAIYRRHGALSRKEATALVDAVLAGISQRLAAGDSVKINGFGSFHVVKRRPRPGRNPRTGEKVLIPGRVAPLFRPSRRILHNLNCQPGSQEKGERGHGH